MRKGRATIRGGVNLFEAIHALREENNLISAAIRSLEALEKIQKRQSVVYTRGDLHIQLGGRGETRRRPKRALREAATYSELRE